MSVSENHKTVTSPFGWQIQLIKDWKHLDPTILNDDAMVFCWSQDPTISMTWMLSGKINADILAKYQVLTLLEGPKSLRESQSIVDAIFPLIGSIKEASVLKLNDSSRALETVESIRNEDDIEHKCGYQLTFRLNSIFHDGARFQRICFYAAVDEFNKWLPSIRTMARSFHYVTAYHPVSKTGLAGPNV